MINHHIRHYIKSIICFKIGIPYVSRIIKTKNIHKFILTSTFKRCVTKSTGTVKFKFESIYEYIII